MSRPRPMRQQGFGLLIFVLLTGIIAFSLVVGYAGLMTREQANGLKGGRATYLQETVAQLEALWRLNAFQLDEASPSNALDGEQLLTMAGVTKKGGIEALVSPILRVPGESTVYRNVVIFYSTETDESNPPDRSLFLLTGEFKSCLDTSLKCAERDFILFNSLEIQRSLAKITQERLLRIAFKAQSYFKARQLQDPERNISVNYFRKPMGGCVVSQMDLDCVDVYTPLTSLTSMTTSSRLLLAVNLGLSNEEMFSGWGRPIQVSNLQDSETNDAPFTLSIRAEIPFGGFKTIKAIQQL